MPDETYMDPKQLEAMLASMGANATSERKVDVAEIGKKNLPEFVDGTEKPLGGHLEKSGITLSLVQLAHPDQDASKYAVVKEFKVPSGDAGKKFQREAEEEIRTTYELSKQDAAIVRVLGYSLMEGEYKLVLPYYAGRTLDFQTTNNGSPNTEQLSVFVDRIGGALSSMHQRGMYHRDVIPRNVFFEHDGDYNSAVLADLGTCSRVTTEFVGTPVFMDLDSLRQHENPAVRDIFAFATMIYTSLDGEQLPYGKPHDILRTRMSNMDLPDKFNQKYWQGELGLTEEALAGEDWQFVVIRAILDQYLATEHEYMPLTAEALDPSLAQNVDQLNAVFSRVFSSQAENSYRTMADLHRDLLAALQPVENVAETLVETENSAEKPAKKRAIFSIRMPEISRMLSGIMNWNKKE